MTTQLPAKLFLLATLCLTALATPAQAVIVHDLRVDFSDVINPNGVWSYWKGTNLMTHYSPVPTAVAPAVANGYWGDAPASLNGAMMLTTANGSAAPPYTDNDFVSGHVLIRTTDPSTGGNTIVKWTAPSAGTFTYSGGVWYADSSQGPFGNLFNLTLNNGPSIESGNASFPNNYTNGIGMVNGLTPTSVNAGDILALELMPTLISPFGTLAGVTWTIDFNPVPEPGTLVLLSMGAIACGICAMRRRAKTTNA